MLLISQPAIKISLLVRVLSDGKISWVLVCVCVLLSFIKLILGWPWSSQHESNSTPTIHTWTLPTLFKSFQLSLHLLQSHCTRGLQLEYANRAKPQEIDRVKSTAWFQHALWALSFQDSELCTLLYPSHFFFGCFAVTQQLHEEPTQVVCSNMEAQKRPARGHSSYNGPWTWRRTHAQVDKQKWNRTQHTSINTQHGCTIHTRNKN